MWFSSWLGKRPRSAPSGRSPVSRRKRPAYRPRLEALEDRWLPSQIGLTVTTLADSGPGTLRAAIQTADAGSHSDKFTIGFSVTGTIDLQSPLPDLNNNIDIEGPGASSLTIERAAGFSFSSAIITVDSGQTASLSGLTIANGNAGGIDNAGTLTVANSAVLNNTAFHTQDTGIFGSGGGIFNQNLSTLTVSGSTVSGNSASFGGGIENLGTLTVGGSTVSGNSALGFDDPFTDNHVVGAGGGIQNLDTMTVSGSTISGNSTDGLGGGMQAGGTQTISNSTLSGNSAFWGGGIDEAGVMTISNCTLSANTALGGGGGMRIGGPTTVSSCTFNNNSATGVTFSFGLHISGSGGAIYMNWANNTVRDTIFNTNSAELGGAIYNPVPLTVTSCAFTRNSATEGGGIYNDAFATLDLRGSTFSANTASDSGGAIYNLGTATLQECTLSGNTAANDGGGIFNGASGTLTIDDSTVCDNFAALGADLYNLGVATINDSDVCVIGP
jgi:predicted outer membrane repeat protein